MEYSQIIIESTQEIFSSMIMLDVSPGEPFIREQGSLKDSISGLIGLAGSTKGMLAIHLSNQTALAVTTAFLGMEVNEIDEIKDVRIGQIAQLGIHIATAQRDADIRPDLPDPPGNGERSEQAAGEWNADSDQSRVVLCDGFVRQLFQPSDEKRLRPFQRFADTPKRRKGNGKLFGIT